MLNTVIAAIYNVSQSLGINVFVTDIPQRSYTGSCVADNLSKANTIFMTSSNRPLLIPNTIWEWMQKPIKDNYTLGYKIMAEIKNSGGTRAVAPYRP